MGLGISSWVTYTKDIIVGFKPAISVNLHDFRSLKESLINKSFFKQMTKLCFKGDSNPGL